MSTTPDSESEKSGPLKQNRYALISTQWGVPLALLAECFPARLTSEEAEIAKKLMQGPDDLPDDKGGNDDAMGV